MSLQMIGLVGLGGFIGTIARYMCGVFISSNWAVPGLNTFVVNIVGSLAIGYLYGVGSERIDVHIMTILTVGVLGGFTTFSAFSAETILFMKEGRVLIALGYVIAMVSFGFLATYLGFSLSKSA